jgi:hypothetical protein
MLSQLLVKLKPQAQDEAFLISDRQIARSTINETRSYVDSCECRARPAAMALTAADALDVLWRLSVLAVMAAA